MRELTDHIVSGDQAVQLKIQVTGEPGPGGAYCKYEITGFDTAANPSRGFKVPVSREIILFQNGSVKEFGVNGVTNEVLLAIVIDRLRSFQNGPYACLENHDALRHLESGLAELQKRTVARIARGVEGTHEK